MIFRPYRRHTGKSQLFDLVADRYRRYRPGVDTLNPKDPRREAVEKLTAMERYVFFKKLPADKQAALMGVLSRDERIEITTAPHLAALEILLKDEDILTQSRELAEEFYGEDNDRLVKAIHRKLIRKATVPVSDLLTQQEQEKFLKQLHVIAPNCQAQGRGWGHVRPNANEALERNPGLAKDDLYMVPLQTMAPSQSRLILTVSPKDALSVAQAIIDLANAGDASVANTRSMKIMGPSWQGRRYDSIVVNFAGFDRDGAQALTAKLHSALPNVKWLKDGLMLDEISDGCGYGETVETGNSVAEEHARIFAAALVEIAGDPSLPHGQVLREKIDEHHRDLLNPALVQHDED